MVEVGGLGPVRGQAGGPGCSRSGSPASPSRCRATRYSVERLRVSSLTFSSALKGGDSFSLVASYADAPVGPPPHARGGRHRPNYWAQAQILAPDVDRADAIPVELEPAGRANVDPTRWPVPVQAPRALLRGVRLVLEDHAHPQPLGLGGDHPPDTAGDHLVDALVHQDVAARKPRSSERGGSAAQPVGLASFRALLTFCLNCGTIEP